MQIMDFEYLSLDLWCQRKGSYNMLRICFFLSFYSSLIPESIAQKLITMGCSHSPKMFSRCSSFTTKIRQYALMKLIFDNLKFEFNFLLENAPLMLKLVAIVRKVDIVKSHDCDMHITV